MLNTQLILRMIIGLLGMSWAWLAWKRMKFTGLIPLAVAITMENIMRVMLIFEIIEGYDPLYTAMLTITTTLYTVGIYYIYKALKKLNGMTQ